MKTYIYHGLRLLLGIIFVVFGLNGFFMFIPVPPMAEAASSFLGALIGTGYMLWLWKGVEIVSGLLLLANRWVPFALVLSAPVVVNIFFFHLILDPPSTPIGLFMVILQGSLAWLTRSAYKGLFSHGPV